ncbi:DUF4174 domain-containing protein [Pseudooceanicola sp. CBS1P-1]|nr:DUF4174 domain-containing protein [Pseudooceanicola endophyticus]
MALPAAAEALFRPLPPAARDLDPMRWQKRPVLIFAPSESDPAYREQRALLEAAQPALQERDIVVLSDTDPAAGGALRKRLDPQGFTVMLVGKDGGIKITERTPLSVERLVETIDRMPMRRREVQP